MTGAETGFLGIDHVPFNVRLRDARLRMGWSRRALAAVSGLTPTTIGRYEALKGWPTPEAAAHIADAVQDAAEYLFPPEVGVLLKGRTARTTTSVLPLEALTLDVPEVRQLVAPDPFDDQTGLPELVEAGLDTLTGRERRVLEMRFGFDGEPLTLREVGELQGVTVERIRQIEAKALRKMRHPDRSRQLVGYVR